MALSRPNFTAHWSDEIRDDAIEFFTAKITVKHPDGPGTFNPTTGTVTPGASGAVLIKDRIGRAQNLRSPIDFNDGNGWQTKLDYRIQIDARPGDPSITKGLIVLVSGGKDPELQKMTFHVGFATNSTDMAVRTIMCSTEGGRNA
jgi:hypothetical protein